MPVRFGPYEVDSASRREGGQAFVYLTTDPRDGARVAVKVARPTKWSRERMEREILTQQSLRHPNILTIREHADDFSWYVTKQAAGSLEDFGPFPREQWMSVRAGMLGIVSAVRHAHDQELIHRDIAPGNVLVFAAGWAVSDWGFVYVPPKKAPRMTLPLERFGTPEFVAPEQIANPHDVGPAADVYSIGRLAAWATGLRPGEGVLSDHPFTAWWRLLIDGTVQVDAAQRWTMRDLATHLRSRPSGGQQLSLEDFRLTDVTREGVCPQCGNDAGSDPAERCHRCRASLAF